MRKPVLVGVDGSARSRAAADWAACAALSRGLPLRIVHVSPVDEAAQAHLWPCRRVPLPEGVVAEVAARHPEAELTGVRLSGPTVPALLAHAAAAELVVLGTRGAGGFAGLALGSTALAVAEHCTRPVALVPSGLACQGTGPRPHPVTLGVDARRPDEAAIDFAFHAAERRGARMRAIHAWALPSPTAEWMPFAVPEQDRGRWEDREVQLLADALRPWRDKYPDVPVLQDAVLFSPAQALVRASRRTELMVVGRSGTTLGPAVDALAHHMGSPVVVVPS
ncbi:universal stress protein [Streptomyces sp. E11-3]|uniref:universal stress protein n=1 Tax=Streptomyces sp. E11-3 TaxID=3110112 RepID=UPI00397F2C1B